MKDKHEKEKVENEINAIIKKLSHSSSGYGDPEALRIDLNKYQFLNDKLLHIRENINKSRERKCYFYSAIIAAIVSSVITYIFDFLSK